MHLPCSAVFVTSPGCLPEPYRYGSICETQAQMLQCSGPGIRGIPRSEPYCAESKAHQKLQKMLRGTAEQGRHSPGSVPSRLLWHATPTSERSNIIGTGSVELRSCDQQPPSTAKALAEKEARPPAFGKLAHVHLELTQSWFPVVSSTP